MAGRKPVLSKTVLANLARAVDRAIVAEGENPTSRSALKDFANAKEWVDGMIVHRADKRAEENDLTQQAEV